MDLIVVISERGQIVKKSNSKIEYRATSRIEKYPLALSLYVLD